MDRYNHSVRIMIKAVFIGIGFVHVAFLVVLMTGGFNAISVYEIGSTVDPTPEPVTPAPVEALVR